MSDDNAPTPETDAERERTTEDELDYVDYVNADFARTLERSRDAALAEVERLRTALKRIAIMSPGGCWAAPCVASDALNKETK